MNLNIKSLGVILLILIIIIGIWFYKNKKDTEISNVQNVVTNNKEIENATNNRNTINISENENIQNISSAENNMNSQENPNNVLNLNDDFELEVDENFSLEKLKSYNLPIILDFGADYCAPCRQMKPTLEKLNKELKGEIIIKVCDVLEYPEYCDGYDVSLIPTQIFINSDGTPFSPENYAELGLTLVKDDNGKHIYTSHVGYLSEEDLNTIIREMK